MGRRKKPCPLGTATNACAWCHLHRITISPKQMKQRKCLQKRCRHLIPWKQHPIWEQKRIAREKRAQRKEKAKLG